jgi:hypothetical protein
MQACLPPEIPRWYDAVASQGENKHSTGEEFGTERLATGYRISKASRRFLGSDLDFEANLQDLCGWHTEISGW